METQTGHISRILEKYGFITGDDGEFVFLHPSNYDGDFSSLRAGSRVTYNKIKTDKGFSALNLKVA